MLKSNIILTIQIWIERLLTYMESSEFFLASASCSSLIFSATCACFSTSEKLLLLTFWAPRPFLAPSWGERTDNIWWFGRSATNLSPLEQCYINLCILKHVRRGQTPNTYPLFSGHGLFLSNEGRFDICSTTNHEHQVTSKLKLFQSPTEHDPASRTWS